MLDLQIQLAVAAVNSEAEEQPPSDEPLSEMVGTLLLYNLNSRWALHAPLLRLFIISNGHYS